MNLLAFDTSTDTLSVAVQHGTRVLAHSGAGGAQASTTLIPTIRALLAQAGITFAQLDAVVFGRGPGSFTGLRTACAVAQGLAFGARGGHGVPVLPVDTLLAVAEQARAAHGCTRVLATLDARMNEVYVAAFEWLADAGAPGGGRWSGPPDFGLCAPEAVTLADGWMLAGNARAAYGERLAPRRPARPCRRTRRCRATYATRWRKPPPSARPRAWPPRRLGHERHGPAFGRYRGPLRGAYARTPGRAHAH